MKRTATSYSNYFIIFQLSIERIDRGGEAEDDAHDGAGMPRTEKVVGAFAEEDEDAKEDNEVDADAREESKGAQCLRHARWRRRFFLLHSLLPHIMNAAYTL